jgi:hypothetical protein
MWSRTQIAMVEKNTIVVINISERKFFDVKLHKNFILCEQDKSGCNLTWRFKTLNVLIFLLFHCYFEENLFVFFEF